MRTDFFDSIDTEEKAYWLGFLAADGNVSRRGVIRLTLAAIDREHVESFGKAIGVAKPLPVRASATCRAFVSLAVGSVEMAGDLARHGIVPAKSLILRPWVGARGLMRHYWRGVFDGDGWLCRRTAGGWELELCGTEAIVRGFQAFVAANTGRRYGGVYPNKSIFRFQTGGLRGAQAIAGLLYADVTIALPRKRSLATAIGQEACRYGDHSQLTPTILAELKQSLGTWKGLPQR